MKQIILMDGSGYHHYYIDGIQERKKPWMRRTKHSISSPILKQYPKNVWIRTSKMLPPNIDTLEILVWCPYHHIGMMPNNAADARRDAKIFLHRVPDEWPELPLHYTHIFSWWMIISPPHMEKGVSTPKGDKKLEKHDYGLKKKMRRTK